MEEETFEDKLCQLINGESLENNSNTPDFILAKFMQSCLDSFHEAVRQRESWYGRVSDGVHNDDEIQRLRRSV